MMFGDRAKTLGVGSLAAVAVLGVLALTPAAGDPPTITPVTVDGKRGFRDASGKLVVGAEFRVCETKWDVAAAALLIDSKPAYIDLHGRVVLGSPGPQPGPQTVIAISKTVREDGSEEQKQQWGFADEDGRVVVEPEFDEFQGFAEGIGRVVKSGRWGFVDSGGRLLVPPRFRRAYWFSEGLSCVTLDDDKRAYVDRHGHIVSDPKYEYTDAWFSEGLAPARWHGKWGYVDKSWKFAVPPRFDSVAQAFSEGLTSVQIDGMTAVVDRTGTVVIAPHKWQVFGFSEGLAVFRLQKSDRWGYIDRDGRVVIPPRFVEAGSFRGGLARVTDSPERWGISGGCWAGYDLINRLGEYVWRGKSHA
jgi:hypothetical protein